MSFSDWTNALEQSFHRTCELLTRLLDGLKARRSAWVSARANVLTPSSELEALTQDVAREENARNELLTQIRRVLPAPLGSDAHHLHLNVTRIAAALPAAAARSLRDAADHARDLAKAVRGEVTVGQRLLQFSQRARIGGLPAAATPSRNGYDRQARCLRAGSAGALVDGRI